MQTIKINIEQTANGYEFTNGNAAVASLRDLMEAMKDDDRNMWRAIYRDNDPDAEKALRDISERAKAISRTAEAMRIKLQTVE